MGSDRDGKSGAGTGRGPVALPTVAAALGATLLVVLLATWAAAIGPGDVFRGEGLPRRTTVEESVPASTESVRTEPSSEAAETERDDPPPWVAVVAVLAQLVTMGLLLYLLYRAARWTSGLRREHQRKAPVTDLAFDVLDEPERVVEAIVSDSAAQRAALLEGRPRNGIVACWHRFETQASSIGLAREPWETSSEFTLRLLDLISADPWAVGELAVLYREARFSDHELGEDGRVRALAALDALHQQLGGRLRGVAQ